MSPPPEEEEAAEAMCDELTTTPIPHPPVLLEEEGEKLRVKLSMGRRGGGRCFLRLGFISHHSILI